MNVKNEYCKGCKEYTRDTHECVSEPASMVNPNGECPCTYCLIKPICDNGCDKYSDYFMGSIG